MTARDNMTTEDDRYALGVLTRQIMLELFAKRHRDGNDVPVPPAILWLTWRAHVDVEGTMSEAERNQARKILYRALLTLTRSQHLVYRAGAYSWNPRRDPPPLFASHAAQKANK